MMTARVGNTRYGYLHENLGDHLLRAMSLVAPVPAYDDVGIDALATLLRPPVKALKYAEGGTFGVQFKAKSVKEIPFDLDDEDNVKDKGHIEWLRDLEIPFFVGVVDSKKASIAIYTMQHAYRELCGGGGIQALTMVFGEDKAESIPFAPKIYFGPPIIEYDIFRGQNGRPMSHPDEWD